MADLARQLRSNHMEYLRALSEGVGGPLEEDGLVLKASLGGAFSFFNEAIVKDGRAAPREETIRDMERFYDEHDIPFIVQVYRGEDGGRFREAMYGFGYKLSSSYAGMAVDRASLRPAHRPAGIELRSIGSKEGLRAFCEAAVRGNVLPPAIGCELVRIMSAVDPLASKKVALLVAERSGTPVATSVLMRGEETAGAYFVSTVPEERGKGIGGWITYQTIRQGMSEGYEVGVLGASSLGYPVYRRLGFFDIATMDEYVKE